MDYHYHTHHKVLLGDLHTPVSTYLKVRDLFPQSALMESSDYHGTENNRSFIGLAFPRNGRVCRILRALRIHNVQCRALFRTYRSERQHRG